MRYKIFATLMLLAIYMLAGRATSELLKLPILADHFNEHRQLNKNVDLISFLVLHYQVEDGTDKDAEEDKKLPFKSIEYFGTTSFVTIITPLQVNDFLNPYLPAPPFYFTHDDDFVSSQFLASIWQPPRNC